MHLHPPLGAKSMVTASPPFLWEEAVWLYTRDCSPLHIHKSAIHLSPMTSLTWSSMYVWLRVSSAPALDDKQVRVCSRAGKENYYGGVV